MCLTKKDDAACTHASSEETHSLTTHFKDQLLQTIRKKPAHKVRRACCYEALQCGYIQQRIFLLLHEP